MNQTTDRWLRGWQGSDMEERWAGLCGPSSWLPGFWWHQPLPFLPWVWGDSCFLYSLCAFSSPSHPWVTTWARGTVTCGGLTILLPALDWGEGPRAASAEEPEQLLPWTFMEGMPGIKAGLCSHCSVPGRKLTRTPALPLSSSHRMTDTW